MIHFSEAKKIINRNTPVLKSNVISLKNALGCVLSKDIQSPLELPVMDNSAMDGFILRFKDTLPATPDRPVILKIKGVIKAGDAKKTHLRKNETYRIMTGAFIPKGGDTVLAKEDALVRSEELFINQPLKVGKHIRLKGEEVKKGECLLKKYSVIHPGTIAILASLGLNKMHVFKKPRVAVITTGSELIPPGKPLKSGKIYDSNSWMLSSLLREMKIPVVFSRTVSDKPQAIKRAIQAALVKSDMLVLIGGVSVGDYDFAKQMLGEVGVKTLFWRIHQKPGKPLYFGKKRNALVFGLPGNPASAYTCFYEYVYPALRQMSGYAKPDLNESEALVQKEIRQNPKKLLFLKGKMTKNLRYQYVEPLFRQGSHMISSLQSMNSIIVIPPGSKTFKKGAKVRVHKIPFYEELTYEG